jgi:hypothetical protein
VEIPSEEWRLIDLSKKASVTIEVSLLVITSFVYIYIRRRELEKTDYPACAIFILNFSEYTPSVLERKRYGKHQQKGVRRQVRKAYPSLGHRNPMSRPHRRLFAVNDCLYRLLTQKLEGIKQTAVVRNWYESNADLAPACCAQASDVSCNLRRL